jgi:hypothetical protein
MFDPLTAGVKADELITVEVLVQDRMWGLANDRADATDGQMADAAMAQIGVVALKTRGASAEAAVEICRQEFYPVGWSGLRDYGSNIANLVVAAAYLRSEIKRRLAAGEDFNRVKRPAEKPYNPATGLPNVSSDEAAS